MGQAQINVRTRACSRTSIVRTKQAALTHNVRGKELKCQTCYQTINANLLWHGGCIFGLIDGVQYDFILCFGLCVTASMNNNFFLGSLIPKKYSRATKCS